MICVSIGRRRHKMMRYEHVRLAEEGAKLVELRVDLLSRQPDISRLLADRPTPVIVTCRRREDRGMWMESEEQRLVVLRSAIVAEADYVDIEKDIADKIPRYGQTKRIVSHHDFDGTPENIEEIHEEMCGKDPDIVKLVTTANSARDMVRILQLVESSTVPTVGFCMGEIGIPSRILCGKFGSPFTYATFSSERPLAPNQLAFEEMRDIYRYDSIDSETRVFGVLGDPISHSLSPRIHNAAFAHDEINAVYIPFRVLRDQFHDDLDAFESLGIEGYSVTIPHKEAALERASTFQGSVREIGAANTLLRLNDGQWLADNTDCQAALDTILIGLGGSPGEEEILQRTKVLILGAGGAARAIGFGLSQAGASVQISSRTNDRAIALANEMNCQQLRWEHRGTALADVIVNCTPVGMHPDMDRSPFRMNWIAEGKLVFDTIYNPENTLLLKDAREFGWKAVSGIEMFVRQAAAQYERFVERAAPLDVMRESIRRSISAVH